jgi:hypothetical protein
VACMGEARSVQGLGRKARTKEPLGRPRRRLKNGIRMDLRLEMCGVDSVGSG